MARIEILCACGCGGTPKRGNRFINGHNARGETRSPETRAKMGLASRLRFQEHPEMLAKLVAAGHTPEVNAKISNALKGRKFTPEHLAKIGMTSRGRVHSLETRAKMSASAHKGPDHHAWTGGRGTYPVGWTGVARRIRKRDGGSCLICGTNKFAPWKGADIHHLDENKSNLEPNNLVSLCRACHKKVQWHLPKYTPFIRAILSKRYGYVYD